MWYVVTFYAGFFAGLFIFALSSIDSSSEDDE